jgi:hypothetical protein
LDFFHGYLELKNAIGHRLPSIGIDAMLYPPLSPINDSLTFGDDLLPAGKNSGPGGPNPKGPEIKSPS